MNDPDASAPENRSALESLFAPKSAAVVGATDREATVGRTVLENLLFSPFRGKTYAVNPNRTEVLGLRSYARIGDVPEKVDLVVVVTLAQTVPDVIGECVDAGVRAAIVISAGFKERGAEGAALELRIQEQLRRGTMRLIGPNCLGAMNPHLGLNATFAQDLARPGNVAFLSRSGALLTAILDWSLEEQVGFSAIVSTGSMLDVGWGDLIDFFGDDPATESILLYMESVGDARSFLSAARDSALPCAIRFPVEDEERNAGSVASHPAGGRTCARKVSSNALRSKRLSPIFPHGKPELTGCA
jgi:acetyltransferase